MNKQQTLDLLEDEVKLGSQARIAYEKFFLPFIKEKRQVFFEAFNSCEPDDIMRLAEIRRMSIVVDAFDKEMQSHLVTSEMAKKQLENMNES
jgi:hypothetical protein